MAFGRLCGLLAATLLLSACGGVGDDLAPSGSDERPSVQAGTTGSAVGQDAPDFTLPDSLGGSVTLSSNLAGTKGAVLYFTMWCPVCDDHMDYLRRAVIPDFGDVRVFAVDYVSGSVADARASEVANGFAGAGFTVLADTAGAVAAAYDATMGTTVVIDSAGAVRMNEDLKDGSRLQVVLQALP